MLPKKANTLNNDGTLSQGAGSGTVSDSLSFTEAGVYTATLTITDDDTGATTSDSSMFVVYDPSAGFVTGGGWFDSPAGAYIADASLTGKANFGFVAKYNRGRTALTGQTEFQFKTANLNFHSDEYIWLVIAGARAQYQGTGTINGSGNYGFKLTAIDGQVSGGGGTDMIRLKIWDKDAGDAIVYDSGLGVSDDDAPSVELGGGKVIIHSQGNALQATEGAAGGGSSGENLSYGRLQPVVNQAIDYWAHAGADASQLNVLSQIDVHLAALSGSHLGMASASTNLIWIDRDAAGMGWSAGNRNGYDLLSTVTHELGHMIGLDHDHMGGSLALGQSRLPSLAARVDQIRATDDLFAGRIESRHSDALHSSQEWSISRRSDRGNMLVATLEGLAKQPLVKPGSSRNLIDQILLEAEESWSVDDYFDSEEGDGDTSENWLDDLVTQL